MTSVGFDDYMFNTEFRDFHEIILPDLEEYLQDLPPWTSLDTLDAERIPCKDLQDPLVTRLSENSDESEECVNRKQCSPVWPFWSSSPLRTCQSPTTQSELKVADFGRRDTFNSLMFDTFAMSKSNNNGCGSDFEKLGVTNSTVGEKRSEKGKRPREELEITKGKRNITTRGEETYREKEKLKKPELLSKHSLSLSSVEDGEEINQQSSIKRLKEFETQQSYTPVLQTGVTPFDDSHNLNFIQSSRDSQTRYSHGISHSSQQTAASNMNPITTTDLHDILFDWGTASLTPPSDSEQGVNIQRLRTSQEHIMQSRRFDTPKSLLGARNRQQLATSNLVLGRSRSSDEIMRGQKSVMKKGRTGFSSSTSFDMNKLLLESSSGNNTRATVRSERCYDVSKTGPHTAAGVEFGSEQRWQRFSPQERIHDHGHVPITFNFTNFNVLHETPAPTSQGELVHTSMPHEVRQQTLSTYPQQSFGVRGEKHTKPTTFTSTSVSRIPTRLPRDLDRRSAFASLENAQLDSILRSKQTIHRGEVCSSRGSPLHRSSEGSKTLFEHPRRAESVEEINSPKQRRVKWTEWDIYTLWKSIEELGNEWREVQNCLPNRTYHQVKDKGRRLLQQESWITGRTKIDSENAGEVAKEIARNVVHRMEQSKTLMLSKRGYAKSYNPRDSSNDRPDETVPKVERSEIFQKHKVPLPSMEMVSQKKYIACNIKSEKINIVKPEDRKLARSESGQDYRKFDWF